MSATTSIMATRPAPVPPGTSVSRMVTTRLFLEYGVATSTTAPGLHE